MGQQSTFYLEPPMGLKSAMSVQSEYFGVLFTGSCLDLLGLRFMTNHFDVVPVRPNDEGSIVV